MKLELSLRQRKEKQVRSQLKKKHFCPKCKSTDLVSSGPDQFCCACDWDTCLEYVEKGLMNKLEVAAWEHFPEINKKQKATVETNEETSLIASA